MLQVEGHGEADVDLDAAVRRRSGENCQARAPVQGVCDRACREGPQSGSTLVREHSKPVGSGRFRDHAQDPRGVLSISFPPPLLLGKRAVWHTLMGEHAGAEVALLAQLRLPLETRSKSILPD
jgi:hypothetical protein